MARVHQQEDTEGDHQETGADLDLPLPFDEGDQQREGKHHHQHGQEMADGPAAQAPQRGRVCSFPLRLKRRAASPSPGSPVIKAARYDSQPEPRSCPIASAQVQTDG
jgi:hypothetical protein